MVAFRKAIRPVFKGSEYDNRMGVVRKLPPSMCAPSAPLCLTFSQIALYQQDNKKSTAALPVSESAMLIISQRTKLLWG